MDCFFRYIFRGELCSARAFFSFEEEPYFVFLWLYDSDIVNEFGDEVSIKTDLKKVLPRKNDYKSLIDLELAIFEALKEQPAFLQEKAKTLGCATRVI